MSVYFKINNRKIGHRYPTYFIADIAANHDGNLKKAIHLIREAKKSGADAAKFQHFSADTIVSDQSFQNFKKQLSHQSGWQKSVYEVYKNASLNLKWTPILKKECKKVGIDFFTSPYSFQLVDHVNRYVPAYKIGSGDITWLEIVKYIASKNKPYIIATGASEIDDVKRVYNACIKINKKIAIMQCNTNYTASDNNFYHINLNVLKTYKRLFPKAILGLSDHTHGDSTVLGAISLGARIIEKHFTLNNNLTGPDHKFSMNPNTWKEMIMRSRKLEYSLGLEQKRIENNENETVIVQRRSIHAKIDLKKNHKLRKNDLKYLRPCPKNGIEPYNFKKVIGKKTKKIISKNSIIILKDLY
jgi:N-acetylneuraminate synthase|tara:strand:- start:98 stop:1168 length:1071 start_codon:yes stop_codon:yes gene_type:complete